MRLPDAERAEIDPSKLTGYLLNPDHPDGRGKAWFFALMGYSRELPQVLERDLRQVAATGTLIETVVTSRGIKYVVDGGATGPLGRAYLVRTVWFTRTGATSPLLVTAYPRLP